MKAIHRMRRAYDVFRALPREIYIVLLINFLNSYRSFGLSSVQYQYMVEDFGMSDLEVGAWLGVNSWVGVVFGLCGAVLVDSIGVRRTAIMALSVAVVARGMLTFGRTRRDLLVTTVFLSPFGEAVLGTGIYTVALKKLTTPENRGLVFGLQYTVFNAAGALADIVADHLRQSDVVAFGLLWSGLRIHIFVTWLVVIAAWAVSVRFLFDADVKELVSPRSYCSPVNFLKNKIEEEGEEEEDGRNTHFDLTQREGFTEGLGLSNGANVENSYNYPLLGTDHVDMVSVGRGNEDAKRYSSAAYVVVPTLTRVSIPSLSGACNLLRRRCFWRALCFSCSVFFIAKEWGDNDQLLPAFLARYYGENVPIYTIHSINLWVCMVGPLVVAPLTSDLEPFSVMLPGLWIMAIAPVFLAIWPSVGSAMLWVFVFSIGELFWSPQLSAWTATLAPTGHEAIFLALLSFKSLITAVPSSAFNGWLNAAMNPNCPKCRDSVGHFCSTPVPCSSGVDMSQKDYEVCSDHEWACKSKTMVCKSLGLNSSLTPTCPRTCQECDGWQGHATLLWTIVLLTSLVTPLLVTFCLPFLRGEAWTCCGYRVCDDMRMEIDQD